MCKNPFANETLLSKKKTQHDYKVLETLCKHWNGLTDENPLQGWFEIKLFLLYLMYLVLASSAGGPGFNPHSWTESYQRRYKNGTSSALV